MRALLMVLLALVIVVGMRLVGVVLISALLVLPGATALHLTRRLLPAFVLSWVAAVTGVLGGLVFSFEFDALRLPSGPCIVLVLVLLFALAALASRTRRHA
jgi:zinc transport system permease protein